MNSYSTDLNLQTLYKFIFHVEICHNKVPQAQCAFSLHRSPTVVAVLKLPSVSSLLMAQSAGWRQKAQGLHLTVNWGCRELTGCSWPPAIVTDFFYLSSWYTFSFLCIELTPNQKLQSKRVKAESVPTHLPRAVSVVSKCPLVMSKTCAFLLSIKSSALNKVYTVPEYSQGVVGVRWQGLQISN